MIKLFTLLILTTFLTSCGIFNNKEKDAVEICQKAKVQFQTNNAYTNVFLNAYGLEINATWLDYANMAAKQDPNKKYAWHAAKTDDNKYYIVDFTDPDGWGQRWEVDVDEQIVKSINQNDYLTRKYGFSRFGGNDEFEITKIQKSGLELLRNYSYFDNTNSSDICYVIKASVLNKTNKPITSATIDGTLKLIFKDKTITGEGNYESGFDSKISESKPWQPNTTKSFYIKTKGIKKIYLNYIPEYILLDISLKAEDPVGYSFDQDIADNDLKDNWKIFKENPTKNTSNEETKKNYSNHNQSSSETYNSNPLDSSIEESDTNH